MSDREIRVGDYVRMKYPTSDDRVSRITGIAGLAFWVDGYKLCTTAHFEPISRKEAFLYKLGALLREFDAEIGDKGIISLEGVEITFGDDTPAVRYPHCTLNADNIMDFEKE